MVWHFIGVYIINRILHGHLEIWNFSSHVEKNISHIRCAHTWNIFQHPKRNFVSLPCNILYVFNPFKSQECPKYQCFAKITINNQDKMLWEFILIKWSSTYKGKCLIFCRAFSKISTCSVVHVVGRESNS